MKTKINNFHSYKDSYFINKVNVDIFIYDIKYTTIQVIYFFL